MNCSNWGMARKCNASELLPTARMDVGMAGRPSGLVLNALNILQPPTRTMRIPPQRRRLEIVVDSGSETEMGEPVKIRHDD
jgi:hypothetical protein